MRRLLFYAEGDAFPRPRSEPLSAAVAHRAGLAGDDRAGGGVRARIEAEVAKPYRIPSSSMEPTLHCARPGAWCEGRFSDRVIANRLAYRFGDPERGQIVVFKAAASASQCDTGDGGSTFVKRLIGLPGEQVSERDSYVYINGHRLAEPYVISRFRDGQTARGRASLPTITSSLGTTAPTRATPGRGEPSPVGISLGQ